MPSWPAAKQVPSDTPVELYTQAVDEEKANIAALLLRPARRGPAILDLTGTDALEDAERITFDATGAALNYKIIVRDGRVVAASCTGGRESATRRSSSTRCRRPACSSALPTDRSISPGAAAASSRTDAARAAELLSQWAPRAGSAAREAPGGAAGMVDVKVVQSRGQYGRRTAAPPVRALSTAEGARLQAWHAQDSFVGEKRKAAARSPTGSTSSSRAAAAAARRR